MLTEKQIKVTQQGVSAFVEYHPKTHKIKRVNVPYINDDASDEFIAAVQGFLDHEVGHVLFSDQSVLFQIKDEPAALKNLDNLIEDVYIERKMSQKFTGSTYNLEQVRSFFLTKITAPAIVKALAVKDLKTAKAYAIVAAFRAWGGQSAAIDFIKDPEIAALIKDLRASIPDDLIARLKTVDNSHEVLQLAREIHKAMSEHEKDKEADKPSKPEPGKGDDGKSPSDSEPGGDETGEKKSGDKSKGKKPSDKKESSDDTEESDTASEPGKSDTDVEPSSPSDKDSKDSEDSDSEESEEEGAAGDSDTDEEEDDESETESSDGADEEGGEGSLTEEEVSELEDMLEALKDFDEEIAEALSKHALEGLESSSSEYHVFSNEWDKIEPAPKSMGERTVSKLDTLVKDKIGVMSKNLERGIAAQAKKAWDGGQRKGRVAPGALFKTAVGDDRVFRKRYETKAKNTAISLVVDCSGSMNGTRIKLAGQAAYGIASVLERLRIPFEVIGFTTAGTAGDLYRAMREEKTTGSWGRIYPLYLPVFKGFNEKFTSDSKSRIAALTERPGWLAENVDGECIKIAARRLAQQRTERHVMMVLSDGSPACPGGSGGNYLLAQHLKATVKELEGQKIETIGIGIQTDCVKNFYPKSVVINDIEELPTTTMKELTKLLLA